MRQRVVSLLGMALLASFGALAQFEAGSVVGTVSDQSHLPVANSTF